MFSNRDFSSWRVSHCLDAEITLQSGELLPGGMCQLLTGSRARYTAIGEARWGSGMNATICLALSQWEIPLKSREVLHVLKGFTGLGPTKGRTDWWSIRWDWTKNLASLLLPNPKGWFWFTSDRSELGHWEEGNSADQLAVSSLVGRCCEKNDFFLQPLGCLL